MRMTKKALKALREKLNLSYKQTWLALTVLAALLIVLVLIVYNIDLIKIQDSEPPVDRTIDYYGLYKTNAIKLTRHSKNYLEENKACTSSYYEISGLKSTETQDKVNQAIKETYDNYNTKSQCIDFVPQANLYNVLSFEIVITNGKTSAETYSGLSFELKDGNKLTASNIFSQDTDRKKLFTDAYINAKTEQNEGESSMTCADGCKACCERENNPDAAAKYEEKRKQSIKAAAEDFASRYANSSEIDFYLSNSIVTIIDPSNKTAKGRYEITGEDVIEGFAYLVNYRTNESLYEDDSLSIEGLFISGRNNNLLTQKTTLEEENGFIDVEYAEYDSTTKDEAIAIQNYLKDTYLNDDEFIVLQASMRFTKMVPKRSPSIAYFDHLNVCHPAKEYFESDMRSVLIRQKAAPSTRYNAAISETSSCQSQSGCVDEADLYPIAILSTDGKVYSKVEDVFDMEKLAQFIQNDPTFLDKGASILDDYYFVLTGVGIALAPDTNKPGARHIPESEYSDYIVEYDWPHLDKDTFKVSLF